MLNAAFKICLRQKISFLPGIASPIFNRAREKTHPGCATAPNALDVQPMNRSASGMFALIWLWSFGSLAVYGQQRPDIEIQSPETSNEKVPLDLFETRAQGLFVLARVAAPAQADLELCP